MKDKGFIVLYRDIFDWEWFDDAYVFKLFVCLIMLANHEPKKYRGITIERGTLLTSIERLSECTFISAKTIKNILKKLKSTGEISEVVKPNKYRIITIKNYNKYQSVGTRRTNKRTNKVTNSVSDKVPDSIPTNNNNISNDISTNKTSVCAQSAHTQQEPSTAPRAPDGRAPAAVTYQQMRRYQIDNAIGSGETVSEFYNGFVKSDTRFPENWQSVYTQYVRADFDAQIEFIERLQSGAYREKWGTADAGA